MLGRRLFVIGKENQEFGTNVYLFMSIIILEEVSRNLKKKESKIWEERDRGKDRTFFFLLFCADDRHFGWLMPFSVMRAQSECWSEK